MAKDRAWELDFLRGIALIMMLFMHMSWDVRYEFGADIFSYLEKDWFWSFVHPIIVVCLSVYQESAARCHAIMLGEA